MLEPPLLEATPPKSNRSLFFITVGVGLLEAGLSIASVQVPPLSEKNLPEKIGLVLGGTVVWPLLVMALFSIGRRFRDTRSRMIIVLGVWGMFVFSHVGILATALRQQTPAENRPDEDEEEEQTEATALEAAAADPSGLVMQKQETILSPEQLKAFDFSPGSNGRLIKLIEQSQASTYHEVVAAYAEACRRKPDDATLALERVRFILRFTDSEDQVIESSQADFTVAKKRLLDRFPEEPGTVLFLLEQSYGPEFEKKAEQYSPLITAWSDKDAAQFLLLRAQRTPETDAEKRARFSLASFRRDPTAEAGISSPRRPPSQAARNMRPRCLRAASSIMPRSGSKRSGWIRCSISVGAPAQ